MHPSNGSTRWRLAQIWFAGIAVSTACSAVLGAIPSVRTVGTLLVLSLLPAGVILARSSAAQVQVAARAKG
ncbi:MAG TPA: hypothetical protein VM032_10900 [Vicinamibacterales bacterium]|nr:hypothetical protein [Vicinamibacterales bacterium]